MRVFRATVPGGSRGASVMRPAARRLISGLAPAKRTKNQGLLRMASGFRLSTVRCNSDQGGTDGCRTASAGFAPSRGGCRGRIRRLRARVGVRQNLWAYYRAHWLAFAGARRAGVEGRCRPAIHREALSVRGAARGCVSRSFQATEVRSRGTCDRAPLRCRTAEIRRLISGQCSYQLTDPYDPEIDRLLAIDLTALSHVNTSIGA